MNCPRRKFLGSAVGAGIVLPVLGAAVKSEAAEKGEKMNKYWFKNKKYGFGLSPVTWQGWVATLCLLVLFIIALFIDMPIASETTAVSVKDCLRFELDVIVLIGLFLSKAFTFLIIVSRWETL